jgi:ABC-type sugar transport system ATPase subunit
LSAAQQQFVQIAKALSRRIRVLIMDEPGAVLSDTELEALFTVVRRLTSSGISVIYISHRLDEIFKIGDRVSVMRQGELVKTTSVSEVTIPEIIRLMVGRRLDENEFRRQTSKTDEIVLSARHLTIRGQLDDVSFDLARGEILGLAGLIGAGRTELLSCLLGVTRPEVGEILLAGRRLRPGSPREAVRQGLGLVPEERREQGLFLGRSVAENVVLPIIDRNSRLGFLLQHRLRHVAESYISRLRIVTPSLEQPVRYLSGGNQQKVVVARWLAAGVRVLLLDEPTRGVDVGAKREIYDIMHELAAEGISIVMASSELPEVLGMSDRVLVMADGRIARELSIEEATKESIMEAAVPRSRLAAVGLAQ